MNKEPVYYRKTEIKEFEDFKDGDCICELCNGWGYFYDCEDNKVSSCYHCRGEGKLDWITNVTGVTGKSGTTGGASLSGSSAFVGSSGTSGVGKISIRPSSQPPPPPKKRVVGRKTIFDKVTVQQSPKIKTIPYKENKKVTWKTKFMNAVADK